MDVDTGVDDECQRFMGSGGDSGDDDLSAGNALYVPGCKEILLHPDELMDSRVCGKSKWEILWSSKTKALGLDGFPLRRQLHSNGQELGFYFCAGRARPRAAREDRQSCYDSQSKRS